MDPVESKLLGAITLDAPWSLIERFSVMPRWLAEDVNKGVDDLVARLESFGVPVVVHEPEIYLSIPLHAEVRAGNTVFRAKPPSNSPSVPDGIEGQLVYLQADPKNIRSYSRNARDLFGDGATSL